jgi:NAD-dependent dihydropyrimidine dehydrogenase PreA subunit
MAGKKITVVISQHQGKNPGKRNLEEEIAAALIMSPEVDVSIVPHVYDMSTDHTGMLFLRSVPGHVVFLTWLYPRAARWILDRQGVRGHEGVTLLKSEDEEFNENEEEAPERQGIGSVNVPNRKMYVLDLRISPDPKIYLDEIDRIAKESSIQTVQLLDWIGGSPKKEQLDRYLAPLPAPNGHGKPVPPNGHNANGQHGKGQNGNGQQLVGHILDEPTKRRWYPVIDYSRCTNCMECIDFCLFGVYGVDQLDRILVEEQDNCKKGCPACSRVCPENAIIFPGHKDSAIAGADGEVGNFKIDLSKLFGATDISPLELAVAERDAELVADGRDAVGMSVGIPRNLAQDEVDELDSLMDGLDDLDL